MPQPAPDREGGALPQALVLVIAVAQYTICLSYCDVLSHLSDTLFSRRHTRVVVVLGCIPIQLQLPRVETFVALSGTASSACLPCDARSPAAHLIPVGDPAARRLLPNGAGTMLLRRAGNRERRLDPVAPALLHAGSHMHPAPPDLQIAGELPVFVLVDRPAFAHTGRAHGACLCDRVEEEHRWMCGVQWLATVDGDGACYLSCLLAECQGAGVVGPLVRNIGCSLAHFYLLARCSSA
jgi:hypothetical protein